MEIRIFKREYDEHTPDLISGKDLLKLAKKESKEDSDFDGEINTIDDAFNYYKGFESIQECDLIGELRCFSSEIESNDKRIAELEAKVKKYEKALEGISDGSNSYDLCGYCDKYLPVIAKQALKGGE